MTRVVTVIRIALTSEERRALRKRDGRSGLATRREIRLLVEQLFTLSLEDAIDVLYDYSEENDE